MCLKSWGSAHDVRVDVEWAGTTGLLAGQRQRSQQTPDPAADSSDYITAILVHCIQSANEWADELAADLA